METDPLVAEAGAETAPVAGWRAWLRAGEDGLLALSLGLMVGLPLLEIVLRRAANSGVTGSAAWVQHLTLAVGMLGGAAAAREGRLLTLSTAVTLLRGRWRTAARLFTGAVGGAVTFWLTMAGADFVASEYAAGGEIAYGVPRWAVELLLPWGFGLICLRLVWKSASGWRGRVAALAGAALLAFIPYAVQIDEQSWLYQSWLDEPARLVGPGLGLLALATVLGLPVFAMLGGAALLFFYGEYSPIASVGLDHYRLVTNPTLPTIPLFTLAGFFLAEGGASARLVRVCQAWVGWVRGGPALAAVAACAFFTSFTGASGVTILALAALLLPALHEAGYRERPALGLLTGAGSLGMLFPPCLPVILYAIIARQEIETMFLAGLLPGLLLLLLTGAYGVWCGPRTAGKKFDRREALASAWAAKWELLVPIVALGGIFGGLATPVEAAAITAAYCFVCETIIYRDLDLWRGVPRTLAKCGLLVGGVLLILGVALGFTGYLIDIQAPAKAVAWVRASIHQPWVFLLCLNGLLIVIGCLMDVFSAIIVMVPLILPMGAAFGIDPLHLGIIFLANLELGYLTPPIGMNLFLASYRFNKPLGEICRAIWPILLVQLGGVLLITYLPALTTWLPGLLK